MSRSYKKTPHSGSNVSGMKKIANRYFRRVSIESIPNNPSSYRKFFNSWNICDYSYIETRNFERYYQSVLSDYILGLSVIPRYEMFNKFPERERVFAEYIRFYRCK